MYSTDLAYIHDAGFGDYARRAAPELVRMLGRQGVRGGRIVEVGCGSGILARHLADAGYDVVGFDISPAMIRLARARVPEARFRVASLTRMRVPRCVAVFAVGEVLTYVPGRLAALRAFFARVHEALEPGGLFVFDFIAAVSGRTYRAKRSTGADWKLVAQASFDASRRELTRRMVMARSTGRVYRQSRETHRVQIYGTREMVDSLERAGFAVKARRSLGRLRLLPGDVAMIATKKAAV